jgi:transcription-repair coupling factor (superfamily II helicase)
VALQGSQVRFAPVELPESKQLRLKRLHPGALVKPAVRTILVPRPSTARVGGQPLRDLDLLRWARDVIDAVLLDDAVAAQSRGRVAAAGAAAATEGRA